MPSSPNRSPGSISATTLSRWSIGLAMAIAMRPLRHDVQRVGRVALLEQHVAAHQLALLGELGERVERRRVGVGEEVGLGQHVPERQLIVRHRARRVLAGCEAAPRFGTVREVANYPAPVTELAADDRLPRGRVDDRRRRRLRAAGSASAKQYEPLGGRRVLDVAVRRGAPASDGVVVVLPSRARPPRGRTRTRARAPSPVARRAATRSGPAWRRCPPTRRSICVHDAARPLATGELFARVVAAVRAGRRRRRPGVAVTDTIKVVDAARHRGRRRPTARRSSPCRRRRRSAPTSCATPTPPAATAPTTPRSSSDSAAGSSMVPGEPWNRKITEPDDLEWARSWLAA